jgi:hypothetical protein
MMYFLAASAVVGMLGFMFFRAAYTLRQERVQNQRDATRGQHSFTRRDRARLLLRQAFKPVPDAAWQAEAPKALADLGNADPPKAEPGDPQQPSAAPELKAASS